MEEALGIELKTQDEDIDTIGGLIMVRTGHVPKTGDIIKVSENVVAEVLDANLRSIKRLKIIYNEEVED
ncbi:MAG UNVERIFIED_CONTAM: hypothetical protein LVQ98_00545 [Rickettsiaceae bacterium]